MKVSLYARVSTYDQTCEIQLRELREYCARREWDVYKEYVDQGISGATIKKRPEFIRLMQDSSVRRFDAVIVHKIDRFGRSLIDLVNSLKELERYDVRFISISQGIDTDKANPAAKFMIHMLCAAAEFERDLAYERSMTAVDQYKKDFAAGIIGKERSSRSGLNKPVGGQKKIFDRQKVFDLRRDGFSFRQISKELQISVGTVNNVLKGVQQPVLLN